MKIFYLIIFLLFALLKTGLSQTLIVVPDSQTIPLTCSKSIMIKIENITGVRAYSILISYQPALIKCEGITKMPFLSSGTSSFFFSEIDSIKGELQMDEAILGVGSQSGSGELVEIKFFGLKIGVDSLVFKNTDLRDEENAHMDITPVGSVVLVSEVSIIDDDRINIPKNILKQNYPNPFNSSTQIEYFLEREQKAELTIYDILGKKIDTIVSEFQKPGEYQINYVADKLSTGNYIYVLIAGNKSYCKLMSVLK
jgi:hypothetical protein